MRVYDDHPDRWDLNPNGDPDNPQDPQPSWNLVLQRRFTATAALRKAVEQLVADW